MDRSGGSRTSSPSVGAYPSTVTVVRRLAATLEGLRPNRRLLVAIEGPDAAGKTTLAGRLRHLLRRPTLTASIDGWHHPREFRTRRGEDSPDGYFHDSFDLVALVTELLNPFRLGAQRVRRSCYDYRSERATNQYAEVAPDTVLIFEGVFLLRPELRQLWDLAVYLHVPEAITLARVLDRDLDFFGNEDTIRRRYEKRYFPGQELYRNVASPLANADILIDNSNPVGPRVLRWTAGVA